MACSRLGTGCSIAHWLSDSSSWLIQRSMSSKSALSTPKSRSFNAQHFIGHRAFHCSTSSRAISVLGIADIVPANTVRQRLDKDRAFSRTALRDGIGTGGPRGLHIVAVDCDFLQAVTSRALGDALAGEKLAAGIASAY